MPPTDGQVPNHEECIEQAYFFETFRDRLLEGMSAQDVLSNVSQELLSSLRLPMAVQFLATDMRHTGRLSSGFQHLKHYFTPFQAYVVSMAEEEKGQFTMDMALLILEREARYKSKEPTRPGLFVFQFEAIARNRLGYDKGLQAAAADPFYDSEWSAYVDLVRRQLGGYDFGELLYVRSELYVQDQRRTRSDYQPSVPALFGIKEGKIAKASYGRDPLYLFAALQRQLGYPEVPKPRPKSDLASQYEMLTTKFREVEARIRMLEAEARGTFDPTQFGTPEMFRKLKDDD